MTGALSNVLPLSKLFVYVLKTKQTKIIYVYIFGKLHLQGAGTLCISVFKSLCLGLFVNSKNTDVLEKHQLQDSHKKQAQAQDQSSWRSKNKICTHCLFTTDLISSEYKQSNSVITKYLGCKMKLLKDWKCSTGVTTLSTALWDGHIQNAVLVLSHCTSEYFKQKEASSSFFSSLLLPNFTKRNKSKSYFSISKTSSCSRVAPSIIKAILYLLVNKYYQKMQLLMVFEKETTSSSHANGVNWVSPNNSSGLLLVSSRNSRNKLNKW